MAGFNRRREQRTPDGTFAPMGRIFIQLRDALDPMKASGPVVTLDQMSPEKRAEMVRLYGNGPKRGPR
jgi:hypothetical protein